MTIEELRSGYAHYNEDKSNESIKFEDFVSRCESDENFRNKFIRQKSAYDPIKFGYSEQDYGFVRTSNSGSIKHWITVFEGGKVQFYAYLAGDEENYNTEPQLMTPNEFKTLAEMFNRNYNG